MTDITDQDLCKALAWAEGSMARGGADAAARYILATVEAPEPTLAEEIMRLPDFTMSGDHCLNDCYDQAKDLASRVGRMETEHAEQALRIDELDQECDRQCLEILDLTSERDTALAEVERLTAEWDDRPAADLPDPADVKPGEAWIVECFGETRTALRVGGDRWVFEDAGGFITTRSNKVRLITHLVPAPRVITTREELDALPEKTVVRSRYGTIREKYDWNNDGKLVWIETGVDGTDRGGFPNLPATVLYEPEA